MKIYISCFRCYNLTYSRSEEMKTLKVTKVYRLAMV